LPSDIRNYPVLPRRLLGLAAFKLPERLVLMDQLPYNPGGKVLKPALRSMVAGDAKADSL